MVKQKLFSVFDSKLGTWMAPMMFAHYGQAERTLKDIASDSGSLMNKYPEDFTLFEIGSFDCDSGLLESLPAPLQVMKGIDAKPRAQSPASVSNVR